MKKILATTACLGMLAWAGSAMATSFTDIVSLNTVIGEGPIAQVLLGDTISYSHLTPADFEVPWDIVNSATLTLAGYYIDDNNDQVSVEGIFVGTLNPGGTIYWSWSSWSLVTNPSLTSLDISAVFSTWSSGAPLDVSITANGDLGDGLLAISTSTFALDYDNATAPAPVPEPATMLLMGTGLAGLVAARREKSKKA